MPDNPPPPAVVPIRSLPGRLFLLTSGLLLLIVVVQQFVALPELLVVFRRVVALGFIGSIVWLGSLAIARNRRAFLWRVRRKLLLSYVFFGFVPVVLTLSFVLVGSVLLYINITSYVFREGYSDVSENLRQIAETSATEIGRNPAVTQAALERKYVNLSGRLPLLSLAVLPVGTPADASKDASRASPPLRSGPWQHEPPPSVVPPWVASAGGFTGTLIVPTGGRAPQLVLRSAVPTSDGQWMVIADLPIDDALAGQFRGRTGIRIDNIVAPEVCRASADLAQDPPAGQGQLFRQTVELLDCTNWTTGTSGRTTVRLDAPVATLYDRLTDEQDAQVAAASRNDAGWNVFLLVLFVLGILLLMVQGAAVVVGGLIARSITSAVHELFEGTERVRQGDFAHRIRIESHDQLGDLAESFNRMSGSIEHLLHVQREKQRLDDELRIAREIQKSLLPVQPPVFAGLGLADLCEPAREVGGDYYDFFDLGSRQLGILIADVSGKGTSAALYMAELKGLMLALSHTERSPRRLLIDLNRRLAGQLDNRSFITMTYAVLDLETRRMTCARAGHTPMLVVSGGEAEMLIPDGMVVGLCLPGAEHRFEELLQEHSRALLPGDVIVLYTDGITEAMDESGELFGDAALARVVTAQHRLDPAGIRERVLREVRSFVGDAEPHDDMTMIVIKVDEEAD